LLLKELNKSLLCILIKVMFLTEFLSKLLSCITFKDYYSLWFLIFWAAQVDINIEQRDRLLLLYLMRVVIILIILKLT